MQHWLDVSEASSVTMIRGAIRRVARRLGYVRGRALFESDYLRSLGFDVRTVIDVGVDSGTPPLYDAFDDCLFVLVEPRREGESLLHQKPDRYLFVNKGLAAESGRRTLRQQDTGKTTFLERTALTDSPIISQYEVDTTTLDELLDSIDFSPPIGIKIDAEGYEIEILKGLTRYWDLVEFVICEANVRRRFVNSFQMSDLISFMLQHDFVFFNFLNVPNPRPLYYDVLFVPRASRLFD
jgi:FkbM family methyltransferase